MSTSKYPSEIKINTNQGGKAAIERLVEVHCFSTRQALADHQEVLKSTLANRYMRDTFPADWIIQCVLETCVSLLRLATTDGPMHLDARSQIIKISNERNDEGKVSEGGYVIFNFSLFPRILNSISFIESDKLVYLIRCNLNEINDGLWVIAINNVVSVCELVRLPNNRVLFETNSKKIECFIDDTNIIAKVIMTGK